MDSGNSWPKNVRPLVGADGNAPSPRASKARALLLCEAPLKLNHRTEPLPAHIRLGRIKEEVFIFSGIGENLILRGQAENWHGLLELHQPLGIWSPRHIASNTKTVNAAGDFKPTGGNIPFVKVRPLRHWVSTTYRIPTLTADMTRYRIVGLSSR